MIHVSCECVTQDLTSYHNNNNAHLTVFGGCFFCIEEEKELVLWFFMYYMDDLETKSPCTRLIVNVKNDIFHEQYQLVRYETLKYSNN